VRLREAVNKALRNVGRVVLLTFVIIYLLIDLIFLSITRPIRRRLMALPWLRDFRAEVGSLNRYAALLLLLVPWLILEPLKPFSIVHRSVYPQTSSQCHAADGRQRSDQTYPA
jgi:hypothetical protein